LLERHGLPENRKKAFELQMGSFGKTRVMTNHNIASNNELERCPKYHQEKHGQKPRTSWYSLKQGELEYKLKFGTLVKPW